MRNRTWLHLALGIALFGVLSSASIGAFWNPKRTTYFTFNRTVQIPGTALPAGTYIFELVDPNGPLDVVRVLNKDRSHVYLTAFTRLVERPRSSKLDAAIVLGETPAGTPPQIKVWYPQDERTGRQFIY